MTRLPPLLRELRAPGGGSAEDTGRHGAAPVEAAGAAFGSMVVAGLWTVIR